MQKTKLLLLLLLVSAHVSAQGQPDSTKQRMMDEIKQRMADSIRAARVDEAALMYPRIRQFSISHQSNFGGTIRSKLRDDEFFSGRIRTARTTVNLTVPIITLNKNIVAASVGFVQQYFDLNEIATINPNYVVSEQDRNVPMFNFSLSYNRRDTLFNIPVSLTAMVGGLFNPDFTSKQLRFTGIVAVPLFRTERSSLTVGVVGNIDPSSLVPVIPLISYSYKFKSLGVDLMADLPQRIAIRKAVTPRASVTMFSEMAGNNSFFGIDEPTPTLPKRMTFATTELRSGLLLEYRLTRKAVVSLSGGLNTTIQSRIFKVGVRQSDYLMSNKTGGMPFVQVGFSLLPFWAPFRK